MYLYSVHIFRNVYMPHSLNQYCNVFRMFQGTFQPLVLLQTVRTRARYFYFSILLAALAGFFGFIEMMFLMKLVQGIISGDFSAITRIFRFRVIPPAFSLSTESYGMTMIVYVTVFFLFAIFTSILSYASALSIEYQIQSADRNLRSMVFNRFLQFGKQYYDKKGLPGLQAILLRHTRLLAEQLRSYHQMLSKLFLLLAYLVVLFLLSWQLTLLTILLFSLVTSLYIALYKRMKHLAWREEQQKYNVDQKVFDILSCIPLVKAYAREMGERENFEKLSLKESSLSFAIQKKMKFVQYAQEILSLIALLVIIIVMSAALSRGNAITASQYIVFYIVLRKIAPCFGAIGDFGMLFARSSVQSNAVLDILQNDKDKYLIPDGNMEFRGLKKHIEFRHLTFGYTKDTPVLDDVSFSIKQGSKTAIVGSTGSGKTTLIHLLLRFYDCAPGAILIDDQDIRDYTLASWRTNVAVVSQDVFLFNDTIRLNIGYGLDNLGEEDMMRAAQKACFHNVITKLPEQLETVIGERGAQLSGGEKQRATIARALLKSADIFILDEASSALDVRTERLVHDAIRDATSDKTLVIISHRLSTIKGADHIIVLDEGRVIEQGTFKTLLEKRGLFYKYWQEQRLDDV